MGRFSDIANEMKGPANRGPFATVAEDMRGEGESALRSSLFAARDKDPDAHANVLSLAERTGLPAPTVERNKPEVEARARFDNIDFGKLMTESPATSKFLSAPDNAAAARDDIENLSGFERLGRAFDRGELLHEQGLAGARYRRTRTPDARRAIDDNKKRLKALGKEGDDWFSYLESASEIVGQQVAALSSPKLAARVGGGGAIGATLGAVGGPLAPVTSSAGALAGMGAGFVSHLAADSLEVEGGLAYIEQLDAGIDPEVARYTSLGVGVLNAALEVASDTVILAPIAKAGKRMLKVGIKESLKKPTVQAAAKQFAQSYAGVVGAEVATEVLQESVNIAAEEIGKTLSEGDFKSVTQEEVTGRLAAIAEKTFKAMVVLGLPGSGVNFVADIRRARRAESNKRVIEALGSSAKASRLRERLPGKYKEFVKSVREQGDVDTVYVDADAAEVLFQSGEIDGLAEDMPYLQGAIREAKVSAAPISIPLEDYVAHIAGTEVHDRLAGDIKFRPDDFTANEAERFNGEVRDILESEMNDARKAAEDERALAEPADKVFEFVRQQLLAAGQAPDVAASQAALHKAFARVMSERYGVAPETLYDGLSVKGPLPSSARSQIDGLDLLIERVRRGIGQSDAQLFGETLSEFVRRLGVKDDRGDLRSRDVDVGKKPFQRNMLRKDGMSLDDVALAAQEAGFFPGFDGNSEQRITINDLLAALTDEGDKRFANPENVDANELARREAAADLAETLDRLGIDIDASNAEIKAALAEQGAVKGGKLFQSNPIAVLTGEEFGVALDADRSTVRRAAKDWYKANLRGRKVESEIGEVRFSNKGTKAISSNPDVSTLRLIPAAESVIVSGDYKGSMEAREARPDGIVRFHRFEGDVVLQGDGVRVAVLVGEDAFGNLFYDLGKTLPPGRPGKVSPGSEGQATDDGSSLNQSIAQDGSNINLEVMGQPDGAGDPRGSIQFLPGGETVINLSEAADLSTFLHESGHLFVRGLADIAELSEDAKADLDAMMKFAGVKTLEEFGAVEPQEKLARAFEAYLREGKAPSADLQGAFDRFRAWLINIYKTLRGLNVELNDEIRAVFDRMLATDEEIRAAEAINRFVVDAGIADLMTPAERQAYGEAAQAATEFAKSELEARKIKEEARETTAWWKEERAKMRAEIEAEFNTRPVYRALDALRDKTNKVRLSRAAVADLLGDEAFTKLPHGIAVKEGGVHPDMIADLVGFSSGDEMLLALMNGAPNKTERAKLIDAEADAKMKERHGSLADNARQAAEAAQDAVRNDKRGTFLEAELKALSRKTGGDPTPASVAKAAAKRIIAGKKTAEATRVGGFAAAEVKAAKEAAKAVLAGDYEAAAEAKRKQLLSHYLFRESRKAADEVDKTVRYFGKFQKKGARSRIDADYLEQIDGLLERFDFRRSVSLKAVEKRKALAQWVADQEAQGLAVVIDDALLNEARRRSFKDMSLEELRGLKDAVKNIEHLGRFKDRLLRKQEARRLSEITAEIADGIRENLGVRESTLETNATRERLRRFGHGAATVLLNADTILREVDGFKNLGPAYMAIKGRLDKAISDKLLPREKKEGERISGLHEAVWTQEERRGFWTRKLIPGTNKSLTKWGQLSVALNVGNAQNRDALIDSGQLTENEIDAVLDGLEEKDWQFVQSVWDYLNEFWPEIAEAQKARTGVAPEKVEAVPVQTKFGEIRGGYYPLVYDKNASIIVSQENANEAIRNMRSGRFSARHTARGHTKERVGSGGRPVMLDISVLSNHVKQVVYDLSIGDETADAYKVLHHKNTKQAFMDAGRLDLWESLDIWLGDVTTGEIHAGDAVSQGLRWLRSGWTLTKLAWNMGTAMLQPLGIFQTSVQLGKRNTLAGVRALLSSPWWGKGNIYKAIAEQSPFMASRIETANKDIADATSQLKEGLRVPSNIKGVDVPKSLQGRQVKMPDVITSSYFFMITRAQLVVDAATWLGAHKKGMADFDGDLEKAGLFADRTVARSQASGIFADRTGFERGTLNANVRQTEMVRVWTALISYFVAKNNVAYERTKKTSFKNPGQVISWAADMALLYTVEAILVGWIRGQLPDDDESWLAYIAKETANAIFAGIPIFREGASEAKGFPGGGVIGSTAADIGKLTTQIEQGEIDAALIKAAARLGGTLIGVPTSQPIKTGSAANKAQEGEDIGLIEYMMGPSYKGR